MSVPQETLESTKLDHVMNKVVYINGKKALSVAAVETVQDMDSPLTRVKVTFLIKQKSLSISEPDANGKQTIKFDYEEEVKS